MSVQMLERAASALLPFLDEIAFLGGATIALWITDEAAPEPRLTKDVDVVVEVASRTDWYRLEARLRSHGLRHDSLSGVICRWKWGEPGDELLIDVMPNDSQILGFENRWQFPALSASASVSLPSGRIIRAVPPSYLIATKLEAWKGRGGGDHLRSKDLEDLINLVDGRAEIVDEIATAPRELRSFVSREISILLKNPKFLDTVDGTVIGYGSGGSGDVDRVDEIVIKRLRSMAQST